MRGEDREASRSRAEIEHALDGRGIVDQRASLAVAAEMRLQELADEGARNDDALVDIEGQAAHVDLVDEIGGRFARGDALMDEIEDGLPSAA